MNFINNFNTILDSWLQSAGILGGLCCCLLILMEPLLPFLPMFIFVTIIMLLWGYIIGFIVAYICSVLGCLVFYIVVKKLLTNKATKIYKKSSKLHGLVKSYKNIKFETLTTIISMPFTPAFMINLLAATSGMSLKKYMGAELIAKIFITIFWGFIGCNLVKCFENPKYLFYIGIMLIAGYIMSKLVNKKYNLD